MCIVRIIMSSPTLRQAALEYRRHAVDVELAKRMGVDRRRSRLRLVSAVWGSIIMTALTDLGRRVPGLVAASSIDDIVDRLEVDIRRVRGLNRGRPAAGLSRSAAPARARLPRMGLPFEGQTSALTAATKGFPWPITYVKSTPPSSTPVASSTWTSSTPPRDPTASRWGRCWPRPATPPSTRLRQHRLDQERHHLHRRRRGHPALPRLPDRAARREVDVPRGLLPADLRRAADRGPSSTSSTTGSAGTRCCTRT